MNWFSAFTLTLLIESPVVRLGAPGKNGQVAGHFLLANAMSHPLLWFGLFPLFTSYGLFFWIGEALVVVLEGAVYMRLMTPTRAMVLSLTANGVSASIGLYLSGNPAVYPVLP